MEMPGHEPTWIDNRKDTYLTRYKFWVRPGIGSGHNFVCEVWDETTEQWLVPMSRYVRDGVAAREAVKGHINQLTTFWTEWVIKRNDSNVVRANNTHYLIGPEDVTFKGFGGRKWEITWLDATREPTTTTNLWSLGVIPPCLRFSLPNNATLES